MVPSRARRALLAALFSGAPPQSVSDLARAARLTPRAVAQQVERLERAGLVTGLTTGPSRMLRAELGLVLDLTADADGLPELRRHAVPLVDARRRRDRVLPDSMSVRERELARRRSPPAARRWHFLVNVTEASLREMVRKHHGTALEDESPHA